MCRESPDSMYRIAQNPSSKLSDADVMLFRETLETIKESPPRQVEALTNNIMPIVVFTDGACEENRQLVTHGAMLIDVSVGVGIKKFFGEVIPVKISDTWNKMANSNWWDKLKCCRC